MADELWVDASPLIVLANIDLLDILPKLAPVVLTTSPVLDEVFRKDDDAARLCRGASITWLRTAAVREPSTKVSEILRRYAVDEGEISLLVTAYERERCEIALDDLAARHAAEALGLPVVGTLGLIVRAHRRGLIASGSAAFRAIVNSSLRVSPALYDWLQAELAD